MKEQRFKNLCSYSILYLTILSILFVYVYLWLGILHLVCSNFLYIGLNFLWLFWCSGGIKIIFSQTLADHFTCLADYVSNFTLTKSIWKLSDRWASLVARKRVVKSSISAAEMHFLKCVCCFLKWMGNHCQKTFKSFRRHSEILKNRELRIFIVLIKSKEFRIQYPIFTFFYWKIL